MDKEALNYWLLTVTLPEVRGGAAAKLGLLIVITT